MVSISLATEATEDQFGGQPTYGIFESMTEENGNEMIDTGAETSGDTIGNRTRGAEYAANETGECFGNVTEGIGPLQWYRTIMSSC